RRGRAMGFLIAGSSAGYAICLGIASLALRFTGWLGALVAVACLPLVSWITGVLVLRATPNMVHARPAGESLVGALPAVWRNRKGMLSIWGYTFHNWELLGIWAWLPAFLTAALVLQGGSPENALLFAALTYVANIAGSIVGGTMADRWGRTRTILLWSCVSLGHRLGDVGAGSVDGSARHVEAAPHSMKPYSDASERNRAPILAVLKRVFRASKIVLEIGSGTGQHAAYFAAELTHLRWQASDVAEHLAGIRLWGVEPTELDVDKPWPE